MISSNNRYLVGLYDNENTLLKAIKKIREDGVSITDALTPFPVHGIEDALGLEDSSLHKAGFLFGLTGFTLALALMTWINYFNYPINFGGKPFFALPSFIPITFELTVLFASVGMVVTYCFRNGLYPGAIPKIMDKRTTDDHFALVFALEENEEQVNIDHINRLLNQTGAVEVKERVFEEDEEIFE
ncbi:MAG: DUF3341 domain-containing protein [Chitinophagales bacterium]|nr:DUF3341 domain-containing protein [Chitinophagales bacterium]